MNKIQFSASKEYLDFKSVVPEPIKNNIPKWYKDIKHTLDEKTVKGCMPFLDTLMTGYLLKMPVDYRISHNLVKEDKRYVGMQTGITWENNPIAQIINVNKHNPEIHNTDQLGKCPYVHTNKDLPIHKILNPWVIKTPPGYSCLFVPPLNNPDDRFSIIPGIVDTDSFPTEINFPIVINGDKYPVLETVIEMGTPYVQIIPFKREAWKMEFKERSYRDIIKEKFFLNFKILHSYKNRFWNKKQWK